MGGRRVTVRSLQVVRVDEENHLLIVQGAVPGAPGSYVLVRKAVAAKPVQVGPKDNASKDKK